MAFRLIALLLGLLNIVQGAPEPSTKAPVRDFDWVNARRDPKGGFYETGQLTRPVGKITDLPGRILDLAWVLKKSVLIVKTTDVVASLDPTTLAILQTLSFPEKDGGSMHGIATKTDDQGAWVTTGVNTLIELNVTKEGKLTWGRKIVLGEKKKSNPLGLTLEPDGKTAWVALAIENTLVKVDLVKGEVVDRVAVGVCPYGVARSADGRHIYVSNFGGRRAKTGDKTEISAGTAVPVDDRSIALNGVISVVETQGKLRESSQIAVGLHPTSLLLDGTTLYVSNVGSDSVSVIDTIAGKVSRTLDTRPDKQLPWGSLPDGLALSEDRLTLYVGLAGLNAVASLDLQSPNTSPLLTPTGWYPGIVTTRGSTLYVALARAGVQLIPHTSKAAERQERDTIAREAARTAHAIEANGAVARTTKPIPVPAKLGDPSTIKHVVYIIKENRTYDQLFGDLGRGNGEPKLCLFPRNVTPNHHSLAETFVLLDNYYCNGVNSADGHMWAVQGITTPYREKDRRDFRCAYDFGTDVLCYAGCGFLWDQALLAGKTFRNYGELDYTIKVRGNTYNDFYQDWKNKTGKTAYEVHYGVDVLRRMSCAKYPGWEMSIPDQVRADVFLEELADFSRKGNLPQLIIIYLPNDHTAKELTPSSYLADNDLALGRIIEGLSKSPFWKDMAVFVNEDDPQTGGDHVDGHRSICLVVSPYAKRGVTVSQFYNQTTVLHTISRILGMPPLNQLVASASTMEACFQETPDFKPYSAHQPAQPLNEQRGAKTSMLSEDQRVLVARADRLDYERPDRIDDDTLNRSIWAQTRPMDRYPEEFMGAHGKGLAALGLKLSEEPDDDDDE
jgi:YVTN family beta-propeller protein